MGVKGNGDMQKLFDEQVELYQNNWEQETNFVVMPNTIRARSYLDIITKDIPVEAIVDNNETMRGTEYLGIPIFHSNDYLHTGNKKKILVSSHYAEIADQLNQLGYEENVDYMDMHSFVSLWYWQKRKEIHLLDVHMAITTYCSLNCKNCNMFMSHYKKEQRKHIGFQEFQDNFDSMFQVVNYCYKVTILGGEPLLNGSLPEMLLWLHGKYHEKIGEIMVVTNGTVLPSTELLNIAKRTQTVFSVSDYSVGADSCSMNVQKTVDRLQQHNIRYRWNREMNWKSFYFPREEQQVKFHTVREHMLCCNPVFRGLNDKKFYYCHIAWSAVEAGLLEENRADYVVLEQIKTDADRKRFLACDLGFVENGHISLCRYCGGCGSDNKSVVRAGEQD